MSEQSVIRRLAAIVAADVAGYSRLIAADEEGTLAALHRHRAELIEPKIAEYRGRIANTAGDSLLIEFPSVGESDAEAKPFPATPVSEKPSIAILPFTNMSDDPKQEYFSDGITEDIITGLSKNRSFFVISRGTSFKYKGASVDVSQIAQELPCAMCWRAASASRATVSGSARS